MNKEFYEITKDLMYNPTVLLMKKYKQHYDTDCYEHCLEVAYWSYLFCKKLNWDYISVARAAVLHDLFLYDWHEKDKLHRWHGYRHPLTASKNAREMCDANEETTKIIETHMWPLTITKVPRSKEAFLVCFVDKIMALAETLKIIK